MPFPAAADQELKEARFPRSHWLGIWNDRPPDRIAPDAFSDCQNILPGLADKRKGNTAHLTTAPSAACQGLHGYYKQATSDRYLLWAANGTLYRDDSTSVKTGLSTTGKFDFATFVDVAYFVNGVDGLGYVSGTTYGKIHPTPVGAVTPYVAADNDLNDATTKIHTAKYITLYKNHVVLGGAPTLPYRVWFSDLTQSASDGAPTYFKSGDAIDFQSPRGGVITGLIGTNSALIVMKDDAIFSVTGAAKATFVVNVITNEMGCPAGRTARYVPGVGVVFQGSDGHYYWISSVDGTDTQFSLKRLSKHFSGQYGDNGIDALNMAKLSENAAGVYGDYYWCAVCTGVTTTPDKVYVMNHRRLAASPDGDPSAAFVPWSVYTHPTANVFTVYNNGTTEYFLAGDNATGQIWRLDAGSYNDATSTAIDAWIRTAKLHLGRPENRKTMPYLHLTYEGLASSSGTMETLCYVDDRPAATLSSLSLAGSTILWGAFTWGSDPWGVTRANRTKRLAVNRSGQLFQFRFRNAQAGTDMRIFEIRTVYTPGLEV